MNIRVGSVVILVSFLCVLVIGRSAEGRTRVGEFHIAGSSIQIDARMWEQLEAKCGPDFMQMAAAYGLFIDEETFFDSQKMSSKEATIAKVRLQNVISALPPHLKQTLLDCLQKENIPFRVSGEEDGSKKWYVRYLESFFGWHDPSRRQLDENPPILDPASSSPSLPSFQSPPDAPGAPSGFDKPPNPLEPSVGGAPPRASEPNLEGNNVLQPQLNSASPGILEPQKQFLGEPKMPTVDPSTKSSPPTIEPRKEPLTAESSPPTTESNKKPSTVESKVVFQPQLDSASAGIPEPQKEFLSPSESEPKKPTEDPWMKSSPPNVEPRKESSTAESSLPNTESNKQPSTAESNSVFQPQLDSASAGVLEPQKELQSLPESDPKKSTEDPLMKSSPPNVESRKEPSTVESSVPNTETNKKPSTTESNSVFQPQLDSAPAGVLEPHKELPSLPESDPKKSTEDPLTKSSPPNTESRKEPSTVESSVPNTETNKKPSTTESNSVFQPQLDSATAGVLEPQKELPSLPESDPKKSTEDPLTKSSPPNTESMKEPSTVESSVPNTETNKKPSTTESNSVFQPQLDSASAGVLEPQKELSSLSASEPQKSAEDPLMKSSPPDTESKKEPSTAESSLPNAESNKKPSTAEINSVSQPQLDSASAGILEPQKELLNLSESEPKKSTEDLSTKSSPPNIESRKEPSTAESFPTDTESNKQPSTAESNTVFQPQLDSSSASILEPQKEFLSLPGSEPENSAEDPSTKSSPPNTEPKKEPSTAESSPPNTELRKEPSTVESSPLNTESNKKPSTVESNSVFQPQLDSAPANILEPQKEFLSLPGSEPEKSTEDPATKSSPPNTEPTKEPTAESSPPNTESRKEPSTAESSPPNTESNNKPSTVESNTVFQPQLDSASPSLLEPQKDFLSLPESEPEKSIEDPSTKSSPPNSESRKEPSTAESSPPNTESSKEPSTAKSSPPNTESRKEPSAAESSPPNTESRKAPSTAESSPPSTESNNKPSTGSHSSATPDSAPHDPTKKHHVVPVSVAIGVTASGAFIFGLVLFCFSQKRTYRQGYEEKDDSPLLTLSLKSASFDASKKSTLGGVAGKEKLESISIGSNTNQSVKSSSLNRKLSTASDISSVHEDSSLSENTGTAALSQESSGAPSNHGLPVRTSSLLKPPPGRSNPPPPGPANPPPSPEPTNPPPPPGPANPPPPPGLAGPRAPGPPPPPSLPGGRTSGAPPPPPPKGATAPRPPQPFNGKSTPYRRNTPGNNGRDGKGAQDESESRKQKLKPFFWDKVLANPDQSMVWDQIRSGSFQFDEEMIENLFGCTTTANKKEKKTGASSQETRQFIQILDAKKAQNISILLKALNVTIEEVNDALHEGNELPVELLQTLLKMAPTEQEELKLRLYSGEMSQLGPAERFLKVVVDIPFAFKRMESLLFKKSLQEEVVSVKESLATLEVASKELKNSRLFLKLLEAVLKTGNRMNDGTFRGGAQAFKLDTLLKLADVKGADGKTTLLHFVVQEIIRSEGKRAARTASEGHDLPIGKSQELEVGDFSQDTENYYRSLGLEVVSGLGGELQNVRKAAGLDSDAITGTVSKLGHGLMRTKNFLNTDMKDTEEDSGFCRKLKSFVEHAEGEIMWLLEEEKRIMALVKSTVDYFHGSAGKDEGLRLFVIVRDFLSMLDRACTEVRKSTPKIQKKETKTATTPGHKKSLSEIRPTSPTSSSHKKTLSVSRAPSLDLQAIADRRMGDSSSDDES